MKLQNKIIPLLISGLFLIPLAQNAYAIEAKNPVTLCERFAGEKDKSVCENKMKTEAPDWYLAGYCSKQFDDSSFYECLNLGKVAKFSPEKIQSCDGSAATDEARLNCLRGIAQVGQKADIYQGRNPAQDKRWEQNGYGRTKLAR